MADQERQIRFLYPPFFLLASLLWGLYLDPNRCLSDILPTTSFPAEASKILGLIAGGGIFIIAAGFLIGAVSVLALRLIFFMLGRRRYEASVSAECLKRIWERVHAAELPDTSKALYAVATFDHEIIPKSIHEWVGRRWSAFHTSVHSCTALVLAIVIGSRISIDVSVEWLVTTLIVCAILATNAFWAWRDTMAMIDFQSHRNLTHTEDAGAKTVSA